MLGKTLRALLLLSLALGATASPARADPAPASEEAPRSIALIVVGDEARSRDVRSALGERHPGGAELSWTHVQQLDPDDVVQPQPPGIVARCFVDLSSHGAARLYFADQNAEAFLVRELPLPRGLDEIGKEELAVIIESSLEALLDRTAPAMTREQVRSVIAGPARASPAAPAPKKRAPARQTTQPATGTPWLSLGVFYGVQGYADHVSIAQGPGARVTLEKRFNRARGSLWASGQYWLPQRYQHELVAVRFDTVAARWGVGVDAPLGRELRAGVRLGAGADLVYITPAQGQVGEANLADARLSWVPLGTFAACLALDLWPHFVLELSVPVDVDMGVRHYDVATVTGRQRVLEPWWVRPGIMLGVVAR